MAKVLILGGTGRIGRAIAADLLSHTDAEITLGGRKVAGATIATAPSNLAERVQFCLLDLADRIGLTTAIAAADLVIHAAGPFHQRDSEVLQLCIDEGAHYLDVSDHRSFTEKVRRHKSEAIAAGITAITNTGIFPGLSNAMVRQDVEALEQVDRVHLSYVVAGSGGAGPTVMRTTFLSLQHPFRAWIEGQWQTVSPYSDCETIRFPAPYGAANVFWFDMPETMTLVEALPIPTLVTKFGSVPDIYNLLTGAIARYCPKAWLSNPKVLEALTWASYGCTQLSDRFTGTGVAIRSEVTGRTAGQAMQVISTLVAADTAIAAGQGTGGLAQLILAGELQKPGVWTVEESLPSLLFQKLVRERHLQYQQTLQSLQSWYQ